MSILFLFLSPRAQQKWKIKLYSKITEVIPKLLNSACVFVKLTSEYDDAQIQLCVSLAVVPNWTVCHSSGMLQKGNPSFSSHFNTLHLKNWVNPFTLGHFIGLLTFSAFTPLHGLFSLFWPLYSFSGIKQ